MLFIYAVCALYVTNFCVRFSGVEEGSGAGPSDAQQLVESERQGASVELSDSTMSNIASKVLSGVDYSFSYEFNMI